MHAMLFRDMFNVYLLFILIFKGRCHNVCKFYFIYIEEYCILNILKKKMNRKLTWNTYHHRFHLIHHLLELIRLFSNH